MLSFESSSSFFLLTILLLHHAGAGEAQPHGSPPDPYGQSFNPSMGVVIIVLIAALFFMGFFSIYIRHCSRDESSISNGPTRRAYVGSVAPSRRAQRGLDRAVIESFPTFDYAAVKELKIGKDALECAVCLTEFEDDDTLRLIPKCDHVFHPDCIDAWLVAHTTCPVCRSNLIPDPELGTCPHAPPQNEVLVNVSEDETTSSVAVEEEARDEHENQERESMEQPLQGRTMSRNRTMRRNISIGRPRSWLGRMRYVRSFSTGHVAVKQWENMERFTLRLPDEVRKQLVNGKLERSTSLVVLPRETSSRRGYRTGTGTGFDEGSSRGGWFGLNRSDRSGRSDRWIFSLAPPFFSRAPSVKSPKVVSAESRQGSLHGSVRSESNRLPV